MPDSSHALYIEKLRFPDQGYAQAYIAKMANMEETYIHQGMCFKRTLVEDTVYEYHYGSIPWAKDLDRQWQMQTEGMDPFLTQPNTKRLKSNSLGGGTVSTVGMTDFDDDYPEDY